MRATDAQEQLKVGDRVIFDYGRHGYTEGHIREISSSYKFVKLAYNVYRDNADWFGISIVKERLDPLPPKKGWFS